MKAKTLACPCTGVFSTPLRADHLHPLPTRPPQCYCGLLTEAAVRKNFMLIYELLDEVMDYGRLQSAVIVALNTLPSPLHPSFQHPSTC